ncbi:MAG: insulinase family protein, partial [Bacteroidales bacterium]|nr:insulinase family protein [Bacteroidales bacterium]
GLYLLTNVLGGPGMNSRLNMLLREKYGFTYHVESNYQPYSDSGHFSIYLGTDTISVEKSIALVFRELKLLREKKMGTLQLQRAKQQMTGQIAISFESSLNEMLSAGKSLLYRNTVDTLPEIYEKIERCTADELREIANEIFIQDQFTMLSYKSVRDEH